MNAAVIDACLALAWVMPDEEVGSEADVLRAHQERRIALLAPTVWEYEVANALRRAVTDGRIAQHFGGESLAALLGMGVLLTGFADLAGRAWQLSLSRTITVYDASYVALAEARTCELYTCDVELATAARDLVTVQLIGRRPERG